MIEGASQVQMIHNKITCPVCGRMADFLEGRLNVTDGGIELVSGPQWSAALIRELGLALRRIPRDRALRPHRRTRGDKRRPCSRPGDDS